MNGTVNRLYDYRNISIPEEMLRIQVDEDAIEYKVKMLALRYAEHGAAEVVEEGDLVFCKADQESYPDGRTILLYTGVKLPGAAMAEDAVLRRKVNDVVETVLQDRQVKLTIQKILRRTPATVSDDWIASLGLDGIRTVEAYRAQVRERMEKDILTERKKEISFYLVTQLEEQSEFSYDKEEMAAYLDTSYVDYVEECKQYGEDLTDVAPEDIKTGIFGQIKQGWMAQAFCEQEGIAVDRAEAEEDAERMLEMMALTGEDTVSKEELVEQGMQNLYLSALYTYMEGYAMEKIGGFNGND